MVQTTEKNQKSNNCSVSNYKFNDFLSIKTSLFSPPTRPQSFYDSLSISRMSSTPSQAPTEPSVNTFTTVSLNAIFTIVVCDQVHNISWKSLLSDGPNNFFTRHFLKAKSRVIHIDRSPDTFALIVRHLRGYSIVPVDECQNQDLLNDAHYFGLKRLTRLLKQFVYLNIGGTTFRLRWELFNKDGPHNYFTGPLRHLHSPHPTLGESAPIYIQRDPETFKDIIRHLQGYSIHIRDEQHRQQLLSDSQFYLFRKLRDKLNTAITRERYSEILLHVEDIKPSQIEVIDKEVYYKQDVPKLLLLTIQLNDFNICCHRVMNDCTFLLEQDIKLIKDPQWAISKIIEFDKDCAIVIGEDHFNIQQYLMHLSQQNQWEKCSIHDQNCNIQWFGIEKAIATVYSAEVKMLFIAFQKMQMIGSRIQANMKRDFLSTSY